MYKLIAGVLCFLTTTIDKTEPVILSNDRKSIEGFSFRVSTFEVLFTERFPFTMFWKETFIYFEFSFNPSCIRSRMEKAKI